MRETGCTACRNMAIVGNAGKGRTKERWNEVVKDDLTKCDGSEMEGSSYGENVRPVRARTRDVKREEREK